MTQIETCSSSQGKRQRRSRRAGILIIVVVALLLVSLGVTALVQLIAIQYRQTQGAEQRQQLQWLAESAIHRATSRLLKSPDYREETWRVPHEALTTGQEYHVRIAAAPVENQLGRYEIRVEVLGIVDTASDVQYRSERTVELPVPSLPPM